MVSEWEVEERVEGEELREAMAAEEGRVGRARRWKKKLGAGRGFAVAQRLADPKIVVVAEWTWAGPVAWQAGRAGDHVQKAVEDDSWRWDWHMGVVVGTHASSGRKQTAGAAGLGYWGVRPPECRPEGRVAVENSREVGVQPDPGWPSDQKAENSYLADAAGTDQREDSDAPGQDWRTRGVDGPPD